MKRRILSITVAACLILGLLSGCGKSEAFLFRYDVPQEITSLDPQFTTDSYSQQLILHLFEPLLRQDENGELQLAAAESYQVSQDGLTYTFTLRQGLTWENETPLTAHDFEFALKRMFNTQSLSPHAQSFVCLKNAQDILDGNLGYDDLGVTATSDTTLVIELDYANPLLPQLLSTAPACPCNQSFFIDTKGKYGLERKYLNTCGPFWLRTWSDTFLQILAWEDYYQADSVKPSGVNFYVGRETSPMDLMLDDKADFGKISYRDVSKAQREGMTVQSYWAQTWVIAFNQEDSTLANQSIRHALSSCVDRDYLKDNLTSNRTLTSYLIPDQVKILSEPFRQVSTNTGHQANLSQGRSLLQEGLYQLDVSKLPTLKLLVPENDNHPYIATLLQKLWQDNLSVYIDLEILPLEEIQSRVAKGDYQLAILSLIPSDNTPSSLVSQFTSTSTENIFGMVDTTFDALVTQTDLATTLESIAQNLSQAEQYLLDHACVVPLYQEEIYYAMRKSVAGIQYNPFGNFAYFQYATAS